MGVSRLSVAMALFSTGNILLNLRQQTQPECEVGEMTDGA